MNGEVVQDSLPVERQTLVRYCARVSGSSAAAEDLAQETLLEMWRMRGRLQDPAKEREWLLGIARNVCLRWRVRRASDRVSASVDADDTETGNQVQAEAVDDFDLEWELDRSELAELLDRALSLLPEPTRAALMHFYLEDMAQSEIAAKLRLQEGTVAVRLHRGRLALRQVLEGPLRAEAESFGLVSPASASWSATRIWCPLCGDRRLEARSHGFALRCPDCSREPNAHLFRCECPDLFEGVRSHRARTHRMQLFSERFYRDAIAHGFRTCDGCRGRAELFLHLPVNAPRSHQSDLGLHVRCPRCEPAEAGGWIRLMMLALAQPEGWAFWRRHPRIRVLPEREATASGIPALVVGFECRQTGDRLEVFLERTSYRRLAAHTTPAR